MEDPKLLKNGHGFLLRAGVRGALFFGVVTLAIFGAYYVWPRAWFGMLFLIGAPSLFLEQVFGLDTSWANNILSGVVLETFVNAVLGALVFIGFAFLRRFLTNTDELP